MKTLLVISIIFNLLLYEPITAQQKEEFGILNNIQMKIDSSFLRSFSDSSINPLEVIEDELIKLDKKSDISENLNYFVNYWLSYLKYHKSIYYLKNNILGKSEKENREAINLLEEYQNKDSEIYALLTLEQSFNFQFIPKQEIFVYMKKVADNRNRANLLDKENIRALYVKASYDFYTPKEYGGGHEVESILLDAIKLKPKRSVSSFAPSWGMELIYDLLIRFYLKTKDKENAKKYFYKAIELFPKNHTLLRYANNFK